MELDSVWLIDFYGGAAIIPPKDYLAPTSSSKAAAPASRTTARSASNSLPKPKPSNKVATARWMAAALGWGFLVTTSSRSDGAQIGESFGNPYSFADAAAGVPYFFASDLDASMIDAFHGNATTKPDPKVSLALSEASLGGTSDTQKQCEIGSGFLSDPENPPCARLVLSGTIKKLAVGDDEEKKGRAALYAKHPSFASYPPGHDFYVAKMEVEKVWLIDQFGGAAIISPKDYFAADPKNFVIV